MSFNRAQAKKSLANAARTTLLASEDFVLTAKIFTINVGDYKSYLQKVYREFHEL